MYLRLINSLSLPAQCCSFSHSTSWRKYISRLLKSTSCWYTTGPIREEIIDGSQAFFLFLKYWLDLWWLWLKSVSLYHTNTKRPVRTIYWGSRNPHSCPWMYQVLVYHLFGRFFFFFFNWQRIYCCTNTNTAALSPVAWLLLCVAWSFYENYFHPFPSFIILALGRSFI